MTFAWVLFLLLSDLAGIKSEPNLERRATLAIDFANQSVTAAREADKAGEEKKFREYLADVEAAAALCQESLDATGKSARRNPKHFKRAELQLRDLLKRLRGLAEQTGIEERDHVEATYKIVTAIHAHILEEIMAKK